MEHREDHVIYDGHEFTLVDVKERLDRIQNKTLGEIDSQSRFEKIRGMKKVTGIAGTVIEESVFSYRINPDRRADLIIDGEPVELKTTGIRAARKNKNSYEAKEPMSITAVQMETIVNESFETSAFWEKAKKMLLVYYLYDSNSTVPAEGYADFPVVGYDFHEFSEEDTEILKREWTLIRDFIAQLQRDYPNPEEEYPRLSSELRDQLIYLDTAPKYPNRPRIRLKRSLVSSIVEQHFNHFDEELDFEIDSLSSVIKKCHEIARKYANLTIRAIAERLGMKTPHSKSASEAIVIKMFGGKSSKLSQVDDFTKASIISKTITLKPQGNRKEDMKLFPLDFEELSNEDMCFETSSFRSWFSENRFLFAVFEDAGIRGDVASNKFLGFKLLSFTEDFIDKEAASTWTRMRELVQNHEILDKPELDADGVPRRGPKGNPMSAPNFPKSKDYDVFVRGTSSDSNHKPLVIQGIRMYHQDYWLKGSVVVNMLNRQDYL